ncbi:MAG TPA: prepilin-type N-terminal cleavage/methylation domain-containing protein [Thermoanaerobaculia bacterium]|nr:prepilin-type N-terminal cleavage/methylation domain-containing protein [Thermoanaerobaculia bacterium]
MNRQKGFTLVELAVSLFVTVSVMLGVLMLFDFSNKLSRVQTNVTDMQQSLRVAQYDVTRLIRMAGRGGLPVGALPDGTALAVRDNVPAGSYIGGAAGTPEIVPGSDVLTVRGVFTAPIYQIASADPTAFQLDLQGGVPVGGTIRVRSSTPTGIPQQLQALRDAIDGERPEGLLLISPQNSDLYAMVELDHAASNVTNPDEFLIAFRITGGTHTTDYARFSSAGPGIYPADLTNAAFVGLVEEYRYYIRQDFAVDGNPASDLTPKLSRARVYPGTQEPYDGDDANWRGDVADNILDLQIALGLDTPYGTGTVAANPTQGVISETADGESDDWLLNGERNFDPAFLAGADLHYVRLNTLARTDRRDKEFRSPELVRIENRAFDASSPFNSREDRMFRRRLLRTVVDVRNL